MQGGGERGEVAFWLWTGFLKRSSHENTQTLHLLGPPPLHPPPPMLVRVFAHTLHFHTHMCSHTTRATCTQAPHTHSSHTHCTYSELKSIHTMHTHTGLPSFPTVKP